MATGSRSRSRPRLWMVFAAVGLSAFVVALAGLVAVRVYDDQLVRQAESELIAQGAVVAEAFRAELARRVGEAPYGSTPTAPWPFPRPEDPSLRPILPSLRATHEVRPPPGHPPPSPVPAEARAREAGEAISGLLSGARSATLAGLRVVDVQGVVVASSGGGVGASLSAREEVARALAGAPASVLYRRESDPDEHPIASLSRDTGVRVVVALPVLHQDRVWGAVVLARTPMTAAKAVYDDRWSLTATGLVLLVMVVLTSLLGAAFVVRPVRALVRQTRAISANEPEGFTPVARPVVQELAELSSALATMATDLRDRNEYIRSFAANVSHEFKTPLSSIHGAVELLRESAQAMTPEERARFLSNIEADAGRLTRLVQRLLELARADAMTTTEAWCELRPALEQVVSAAVQDGVRARLGEVPENARVPVPREVVDATVSQLVANARQHAGDVEVTVRVDALGEGGYRIVVEDGGPGISEFNRARVFDAFFTTARASGGTGLGLTIARAMLRSVGGRLELLPPGRTGAAFAVVLPERRG